MWRNIWELGTWIWNSTQNFSKAILYYSLIPCPEFLLTPYVLFSSKYWLQSSYLFTWYFGLYVTTLLLHMLLEEYQNYNLQNWDGKHWRVVQNIQILLRHTSLAFLPSQVLGEPKTPSRPDCILQLSDSCPHITTSSSPQSFLLEFWPFATPISIPWWYPWVVAKAHSAILSGQSSRLFSIFYTWMWPLV